MQVVRKYRATRDTGTSKNKTIRNCFIRTRFFLFYSTSMDSLLFYSFQCNMDTRLVSFLLWNLQKKFGYKFKKGLEVYFVNRDVLLFLVIALDSWCDGTKRSIAQKPKHGTRFVSGNTSDYPMFFAYDRVMKSVA